MADHTKWLLSPWRRAIVERHANGIETVSSVESQITWDVERQLRWTTCAFIEDLAGLVSIPSAPSILAQLYVQRFYTLHSFGKHDRFLVATAALFLAGKTEEFPIKVRLMTECALYLLHCKPKPDDGKQQHQQNHHQRDAAQRKRKSASGRAVEMSASLGNDPEAANAKHLDCLHHLLNVIDVGEIETTAARVLLLERVVLQTIAFDLSIPQPFAYVPRCMEPLFALEAMHPSIPYDAIRSMAFILLADAVKSGLVLAFDCTELAAGAVYLSCLYRNYVPANVTTESNEPWWSIWSLSKKELEEAASGILWIYEEQNQKRPLSGTGDAFSALWDRYKPDDNLPDLEYVKQLDADVQKQQLRSPI